MDVFISWSGETSKAIAQAIRGWLPDVLQALRPWMSELDIQAGARWTAEMQERLSRTRFGIICLTPDNLREPWIHFEAGALAKTVENTYVCPYLFGFKESDIPQGPLSQFQAKRATKEGTLDIVTTLNGALDVGALDEQDLRRAFALWWPELHKALDELPPPTKTGGERRSTDDVLEEMLVLLRRMESRESTLGGAGTLRLVASGTLAEAERRAIAEALGSCDGNKTQAARVLGISRQTLRSKLRDYGLLGVDVEDAEHGRDVAQARSLVEPGTS